MFLTFAELICLELRNWKIYFVALLAGLLAGGLCLMANEDGSSEALPLKPDAYTFSAGPNGSGISSDLTHGFYLAGQGQVSLSVSAQDFHHYSDNHPPAENRKIEKQIHSYLCFARTFPSSESLSRLRRLNI